MSASGADLAEQAIAGDMHALTILLERFGPDVRRKLAPEIPSRWRSVLSPEDVMQETYIDAFLDVHQFQLRGEDSFSSWLMTIAKRNLLDALRMLDADKRIHANRQVGSGQNAGNFDSLHEQLAWTRTTPSRHAARTESRLLLQRAIEQLPHIYRTVVSMYDLEGKAVREIAAALHRSPGAVLMLRSRAHRLLSAKLGTASLYLSDTA
jgi:RNA polymerase sigma-70 factor (ECF subfamily)